MKRTILFSLVMAFLVTLPQVMLACPNCKESYIEGGGSVSAGYSASILFMMITPFVVMSIVAIRIYISARKKKQEDFHGA